MSFFSQLMFISQRTQKAKLAVAEANSFHVGWSVQIQSFLTASSYPNKSCFLLHWDITYQNLQLRALLFHGLTGAKNQLRCTTASWKDKYSVFHVCNCSIVAIVRVTVKAEQCAVEL